VARARERNIDDAIALSIVEVIDGWSGKLSWCLLIEEVARRTGLTYTRQTLHRHERIRVAFSAHRKALPHATSDPVSRFPEVQLLLDKLARLEGENRRLIAENGALLEQFVRWAYNAHTRGLSEAFLNSALPLVDRKRSMKGGD